MNVFKRCETYGSAATPPLRGGGHSVGVFKRCTKCHIEQAYCEFYIYIKPNGDNAHRPSCKSCQKQYKQDNIEHFQQYKREYDEKNKDKLTIKRKKHYQENKKRISGKKKVYYEQNKDILIEKSKQYYKQNKKEICKKRNQYYKLKIKQIN